MAKKQIDKKIDIKLLDGERLIREGNEENKNNKNNKNDESITNKYKKSVNRIVTEPANFKLSIIPELFEKGILTGNDHYYDLYPDYQRTDDQVNNEDKREIWSKGQQSRLIESFIMNIPVPPVFLYEIDFDKYEVMDGVQRIRTILKFYKNELILEDLEKWTELEGYKYKDLNDVIKSGINRRQLSAIILLKESAESEEESKNIRKTVFKRLNTGGVGLNAQEIRNALYQGVFNDFCKELAKDENFQKLWENSKAKLKRMSKVELVLIFFALRQSDDYDIEKKKDLDDFFENANKYFDGKNEILEKLEKIFKEVMEICFKLFGDKAFCRVTKTGWGLPQKNCYYSMCQAIMKNLEKLRNIVDKTKVEKNIELLKNMYEKNNDKFEAKNKSIDNRFEKYEKLDKVLKEIIEKARKNG